MGGAIPAPMSSLRCKQELLPLMCSCRLVMVGAGIFGIVLGEIAGGEVLLLVFGEDTAPRRTPVSQQLELDFTTPAP